MPYTAWTNNLINNGSFEAGLSGWSPLLGSTLTRTSQDAVAGQYSMLVETPGAQVGEGVIGPQALVTATVTGSVQVSIYGETGKLTVSAAVNPDGILLAQQSVTLSGSWQRVILNGLPISNTQSIYIYIQTSGSAQALSFLVDAVQYEPESPAHPYIDGSFTGAEWTGTPFASSSYQQGQFSISLLGGINLEGTIKVSIRGQVFQLPATTGNITSGGSVSLVVGSPVAAFDDFAIYESTDSDPAQTYVGWNTAGLLSGHAAYTRPYGIFYPPVDYVVSGGEYLWKRAAFMAMGLQYTNVATGAAQNLTQAQVEMMPLAGSTGLDIEPVPSAYDTPRALHVNVKPARLNYCTNPNFAVDLTGWSALPSTALTQDNTVTYGIIGSFDGVNYVAGYSAKIVVSAKGGGTVITIPDLIAGDLYTASIYALPTGTVTDVAMTVGNQVGGVPGADGVTPLNTLFPGAYPVQNWVRSQVTFTAPADTVVLSVQPLFTGSCTVHLNMCLIGTGEVAGTYFDGSVGDPDYMWEGTPGKSRSYWYPNYKVGIETVADIIANHTPFSISAAEPVYLTPPTQ